MSVEANATDPAQGDGQYPQASLVQAMMQRAFYPKAPAEVLYRETHFSHIFLVGDLVYKVKKALRQPSLDFSTPDKRRHFLLEELRLNRRLAPSVYLAVVPISCGERGWHLSAEADAADYALVMRRLPERRMLRFLLSTQQVTADMMRELAEVIAGFHAEAERPKSTVDAQRQLRIVESQWNTNVRELRELIGTVIDGDTYNSISDFGAEFLKSHADLIKRRAEQGRVRELHGDLHSEHICFAPEGIQIFDCVEFNAQLRCCDVASELALLTMDLEMSDATEHARVFLKRYAEISSDPDLPSLLPFYRCHHALVSGKLRALRSHEGDADGARYFRYASRVTWEPLRPFIVLLCGLPGSGKSTLGRELSERLNLPLISSEVWRTELAAKSERQLASGGMGIYEAALTDKTYAKMARETEKRIIAGTGAILDSTFAQRAHRDKIARVAAKHRISLFLIHCTAPEQVVRTRLAEAAASRDSSAAPWDVYVQAKAGCQPIRELPAADCLNLDTEPPLAEVAAVCERFLRERLAAERF